MVIDVVLNRLSPAEIELTRAIMVSQRTLVLGCFWTQLGRLGLAFRPRRIVGGIRAVPDEATVVDVVTFSVDDVHPAAVALPTRPLREVYADALVVGGDSELPVVAPDGVHPLLSAVGRAFAEHRPLVLSPDAVWLTIAQGVAQHVRLHAEDLRARLVSHTGRKRLVVRHDGPMPTDARSWAAMVQSWSGQLAAEVTDAGLFACDFSTSTQVERIAGQVVVLDAYSSYYSIWLVCVCGIPTVTLTGTVQDWQRIRQRVDALAGFGLQNWCRSLEPIADQFVRAASGDVDTAFWRRIYNPADAYGGAVITGWVARLYPYLRAESVVNWPNPLLDLPIDEPRDYPTSSMGYTGPGVRSDAVPVALSRVVVNVNDQVGRDNRTVALHAGLVAVVQDHDGTLRPVAGWHVTPAEPQIDDVIDAIIRDHQATEPCDERLWFGCADVVALYRRIGSATLFDGTWRIRRVAEHQRMHRGSNALSIVTIIDLADGSSIGAALDDETQTFHWLRYHTDEESAPRPILREQPEDVPVYGTSLAMLLAAALDSSGDISHLRTGHLAELKSRTMARQPAEKPATSRQETRRPEQVPPPDDGADIKEQIDWVLRAKELAIDEQDFERAGQLRTREKQLRARASREGQPSS